jgi:ABC-type sugar transport system permease subunit
VFVVLPFTIAFVLAFTNQRLLNDATFHRTLHNNFAFATTVVTAQAPPSFSSSL